ncbi:RDD family protein [Micromonospora craniellae]|uniref:RDD family protein n=1 Tax=Micromonospora craniellae TaxID=2294034 RepID=A0A372FWQ0_9ACTN|nr:RDD family protein [Micromonospora craniellae]QOC90020.1 RDD family protein [Micromonospora craniellae]RFS45221.1 RDD family protein [Micromonospora craniellae]
MTQPPVHPPPLGHPHPVPPQFAPPGQPPPPDWPGPPGAGWSGPPRQQPPPGWAPGTVPPVLGPGGQPLAVFGDRLVAYLIDVAIATAVVMVLFVPAFLLVWFQMMRTITRTNPDGTLVEPDAGTVFTDFVLPMLLLQAGLFVVMFGLYWVYHVEYLIRQGGQTVGKRVMKLRVVTLDPTRVLDRRVAGRRYLVQFVGGSLVPGGSYIDGLWQLWDKPWQQCLHDKFAGTVVVKVAR